MHGTFTPVLRYPVSGPLLTHTDLVQVTRRDTSTKGGVLAEAAVAVVESRWMHSVPRREGTILAQAQFPPRPCRKWPTSRPRSKRECAPAFRQLLCLARKQVSRTGHRARVRQERCRQGPCLLARAASAMIPEGKKRKYFPKMRRAGTLSVLKQACIGTSLLRERRILRRTSDNVHGVC
jgi:hypothetical protein